MERTDELTPDVWQIIFRYLSVEDIWNMQSVRQEWREMMQEEEIWKHKTFHIKKKTDLGKVEEMLKNMPMLQNLTTHPEVSLPYNFLDIMFQNMQSVKKLNCKFCPPISHSDTQNILSKYPGLESLALDCSTNDVLKSLELLKVDPGKVKGLMFYRTIHYEEIGMIKFLKNMYVQICDCLSSFPNLQELDFAAFNVMDSVLMNNAFLRVLQEHSLKYLRASFYPDTGILEALEKCTTLVKLDLTIVFHKGYKNSVLKIRDLENLKAARLVFKHDLLDVADFKKFVSESIHESLIVGHMNNMTHLQIKIENDYCAARNILQRIIFNAPQLKRLSLYIYKYPNINNEMQLIRLMSKLEQLTISITQTRLKVQTFIYVSFLKNLKVLKFKGPMLFDWGKSYEENRVSVKVVRKMLRKLNLLKQFDLQESAITKLRPSLVLKLERSCERKRIIFNHGAH